MSEAAQSTVEAVMFELREDGLAALAAASCRRRLVDLSKTQIKECIVRLGRLRPQYPKITDDLLLRLEEMI
jgi:hypothetical protein